MSWEEVTLMSEKCSKSKLTSDLLFLLLRSQNVSPSLVPLSRTLAFCYLTKLLGEWSRDITPRPFHRMYAQKSNQPRIPSPFTSNSALDTTSEGIVQQALDQASVGRTTITIAHRLSTIKKADNIIVMGKGRILEQGTHDALLSNPNGPYSSLVNAQKIRANVSNADNAYEQEEELEAERLRAEEALKKEAEKLPELGGRVSRSRSITSVLMADKAALKELEGKEKMHGTLYLLRRLALINKEHIVSGFGVICTQLDARKTDISPLSSHFPSFTVDSLRPWVHCFRLCWRLVHFQTMNRRKLISSQAPTDNRDLSLSLLFRRLPFL